MFSEDNIFLILAIVLVGESSLYLFMQHEKFGVFLKGTA